MRSPAPTFRTRVVAIAAILASSSLPCASAQETAPTATPTPSTAAAQAASPAAKPPAYADESIVIVQSDSAYLYAADGTGTQERTVVARIQSDAAVRAVGVIAVAFAANSQHVDFLYARVRHPDGTTTETPPADALDVPDPVTREAPFYSDLKQKQLPIRGLRVGDTLEWKARITTTKSEAPGQFWGQESFPEGAVVLSETVELGLPASVSLTVWSPTLKPVESLADGQKIYRWTSSQLKPTAGKEADAEAEAKKKTVWTAGQEIDNDQGKLPDIAWTTFKSWEDVGAWYRSLEVGRATPTPEIQAKVAELIAGKSTDQAKVRALYAYVATQIRYVGVAFGVGRYQPHTADEVLNNQYGDCKDKHTLLAAMLAAVGIQSDAALIGAGVRFNPEVPSPAAFNHLITHLVVSPAPDQPAQPVWLDTTSEIAPYRMLVSVIRDKQALVVPNAGPARLDRTPADPPFPSFQTMDATGSLDKDGVSHSRITLVLRGDTELALRAAFHQTAPAQYLEMVQQIVQGMGYAGTASNADVARPDDTDPPFKFSFDYEREKAGDWDNYRIIPQVAPVDLPRFADTDPLVRILDLGTPQVQASHSAMKLPQGWGAVLPEEVHVKSPYATYDETYRFDNGTVYADRRIEILKQKVPTADLATYKKFANDADLGNDSYIQLTRTSASTPASSTAASPKPGASTPDTATPTTSDGPPVIPQVIEKVQGLLQKAADLDRQHNYAGVVNILDQIKALNPEQPYLWESYGDMAIKQGHPLEAVEDYKKEIKLHPESLYGYHPLEQLQMVCGLKKDAIDTLRAWVAADPSSPDAAGKLMDMLLDDGDAASALSVGDSALAHLPESAQKEESFQLALGRAQLAARENDKGAATLETLLNSSQNPEVTNDAAYALADASLDLPLAETSISTSIEKLTQQSNSWTLDEDPLLLAANTHRIVAAWETLGWIYFREGKLNQAMTYIHASWVNLPNLETGKHLGDVLSAQGDRPAALACYELAIESQPFYNPLNVHTQPTNQQKQVQALADTLQRGGVGVAATLRAKKLLEPRTVPLGPANGRAGDAEYRVLLKDGKAVKIRPAGDKMIRDAEDMLSKASFSAYFPKDSTAALVRNAYVNCHSDVCELVLEP